MSKDQILLLYHIRIPKEEIENIVERGENKRDTT